MNQFDQLVREQLKTMDKLLYLQSEIERCEEIKVQLNNLQDESKAESVQFEIEQMRLQLYQIQHMFEKQTKEVIWSYQNQKVETVS